MQKRKLSIMMFMNFYEGFVKRWHRAVSKDPLFNLAYNEAFYFHKFFEIHLPRAIPTEIFTAVVIYWCNE